MPRSIPNIFTIEFQKNESAHGSSPALNGSVRANNPRRGWRLNSLDVFRVGFRFPEQSG